MLYKSTNNTVQTFWVALGSLSAFGLAIVSSAILSRYLDKQEYGTYRQIIFTYSTLLVVFSAGLPRVFSYFLPRYSLEEGKAIVKKVSIVLFVCGLVFSVCLYFFSGLIASTLNNNALEYGLKVFAPVPLLLLPTLGIEGIFSTYKKTVYIAIYNTITRGVMLLFIIIPVVVYKASYIYAIYGWIVASLFTFLIALFFKSIPFKNIQSTNTELKLNDILRYSLPLVAASLWGIAIKASDTFYISRFFGEEAYAVYVNGFINLPFVTMITSSTAVVLMPIFSKHFHKKTSKTEVLEIWRSTLKKSAFLIYPLLVYFMVFAKDVIILLFTKDYVGSSIYFRINLILNLFSIIVFAPLFLSTGKTRWYARVHMILAIIIWITGYIVILIFDTPIGIAINSTCINIIKVFVFVYLASKILEIRFFKFFPLRQMALSLLQSGIIISLVCIINDNFFKIDNNLFQLVVTFCLFGVLTLGTGKLFGLNYFAVFKPFLKRINNE